MGILRKRAERKKRRARSRQHFILLDPDLLYGMATTIDVFGNLNRPWGHRSPLETDLDALRGDYYIIADDLWNAVNWYEHHYLNPDPGQQRLFDPTTLDKKR